MRVTHPFHPLRGQQFVSVGTRYGRYGTQILLVLDDGLVRGVARQWTDLVAPDPEVVIGEARAIVRVRDLLELDKLVAQLRRRGGTNSGDWSVK